MATRDEINAEFYRGQLGDTSLTPDQVNTSFYGKPQPKTDYLSYLNPANYNVFGGQPSMYEGLLGQPQAQALSRQSNIAGLLGSVAALASGMSSQGPKRSALQNILNALGTGYGASMATTQQGLQNYGLQQQILGQQLQRQKTMRDIEREQAAIGSIDELIKTDPTIDPAMRAYLLNNKDKALEMYMQRRNLQQFMAGKTQPEQAIAPSAEVAAYNEQMSPYLVSGGDTRVVPQAAPMREPTGPLAAGTVETAPVPEPFTGRFGALPTAPTPKAVVPANPLDAQIKNADLMAEYFTNPVSNDPTKAKQFQDIAKDLRDRSRKTGLVGDVDPQLNLVFPTLEKRVASLKKRMPNLTQEQIVNEQNDILKDDAKLLESLDPTLQAAELKRRRAQATVIDMGSRKMEEEVAKDVVGNISATFAQAKAATNTAKTIARLQPLLQEGVYDSFKAGVPRSIDQMATALGVTGKDTQEKLQRTAVAMQNLAALELQSAEAMKGQGAITENERSLIARAAGGNLRDFTTGEVNALVNALGTVANSKIQAHQQNFETMSQDPRMQKYIQYYKIEPPKSIIKKYDPATGRIQ